jgi:hypothetical protein
MGAEQMEGAFWPGNEPLLPDPGQSLSTPSHISSAIDLAALAEIDIKPSLARPVQLSPYLSPSAQHRQNNFHIPDQNVNHIYSPHTAFNRLNDLTQAPSSAIPGMRSSMVYHSGLEVEAFVFGTSNGLVVILRRAAPFGPNLVPGGLNTDCRSADIGL